MQLIATKLYISPAPADYVSCPHLSRKLGEISTCKLAILSAPAGFGKTTLLGAWFREMARQSLDIRACWLSLDPEDNEPGRFRDALVSSLEDAGIPLSAVSSLLPATHIADQPSMLKALLQDLSSIPGDVVLIFDDYHLITSEEVHALVRQLISHAPPSLHLLVSTRTQPPFEISRLRLSGQLLELGPADLRFTLDETREYLRLAQEFPLPEEDIVTIAEKTEGWIAGLKMAVLAMQKSEDPMAMVKTLHGSHRYIFDYLMEQVLAQQPPEVQEFLLSTSIAGTFNASLCDALLQEGNYPPGTSQRILAYLEQANLFILPLDDERQWFRYHHLFSDVLRSILQQTAPHRVPALHGYASDWHERNHMISDAVSHALAAGQVERAARLVSANVLLLVDQTELRPILRRLDSLLTGNQPTENPWLNVAYAWVLAFSGEMKRATAVLQRIEPQTLLLADAHQRNDLRGYLLAIQAYMLWIEGHFESALRLARQADEDLSGLDTAVRALNLHTMARVLVNQDRYEEALQFSQQAIEIGDLLEQPYLVMLAKTSLAYIYLNMGQIGKSAEICEQALDQADAYRRKYGRILPPASGVYTIRAHHYCDRYDLEKALWYAKRALYFSQVWGQSEELFSATWVLTRVLSARKEHEAALRIVKMPQLAGPASPDWDIYLNKTLEAHVYFNQGKVEETRKNIADLTEMAGRMDLDPTKQDPTWKLSISLMIIDGECEKALHRIDLLSGQTFFGFKGAYQNLELLLLRAWACHTMGDNRAAITALETALQYARPEMTIQPFVTYYQYLEDPMRSIAGKGAHREILDRVFSICQEKSSVSTKGTDKDFDPAAEGLIEPLTERELEILRLLSSHLPTPEIADLLALSVNTVRTHIKSIYAKLGAHSRSSAIEKSRRLKLLA